MKKRFLIACIVLLHISAKSQSIYIAPYADNKQAALSLTFDDGLKEHYSILFPKLKELGIRATFGIVGSRIENPPKNPEKSTFSWQNAREMIAEGHEITNHGWEHKNVTTLSVGELRYEVQHNDTIIYRQTGYFPRTYIYPGNRKSEEAVAFCSKDRTGTRTKQISLGSGRTQMWFENWLNNIITTNDWGITMTHGIRIGYDCFGDETRFWEMLQYAHSKKELWIATLHDVSAYIAERNNTTLSIKQIKNKTLVTLTNHLDKSVFDVPLTLVMEKKPVSVTQGGNTLKVVQQSKLYLTNFDIHKGDLIITN